MVKDEIPNDMLQRHQENRLRRFYEPLTLLSTLGDARGPRIKHTQPVEESLGFNVHESRRTFVDALAYICAYKKEPGYVTAAALERKPDEIVVWLAANTQVDSTVISFLEYVLKWISWLAFQSPERLDRQTRERIQLHLTGRIIRFNSAKIFAYYQKIVDTAGPALIHRLTLEDKEDQEVTELCEWMRANLFKEGFQLQEADMESLAIKCYNDRSRFRILRRLAEVSRLTEASECLDKLLGKVGKHVVISKRLIVATIHLRQELSYTLRVGAVPSAPECRIPLLERKYNIDGISNRMFSNKSEKERFRDRLRKIYPQDDHLDRILVENHLRKKTFVHAELLIINHFEKTNGEFLDNSDKYIGCSKPACYLCYLFIYHHPRRYARPPSHQKLYVNWRLPDIALNEFDAAKRFKDQEHILQEMTKHIRRDLDNDIVNRTGKSHSVEDSTAGGTTTVYEIEDRLAKDLSSLSFEELQDMIDGQSETVTLPETTDTSSESHLSLSGSQPDQNDPCSEDECTDDEGGVRVS